MAEMSTREIQERIEQIKPDTPQKRRRKKIWNTIFIVFNVLVLALVFILNPPKTEGESLVGVLRHANGWYLLLSFGLLLLIILAETLIFFYLIKLTTGRWRFRLAAKTALVGRYYDSVTPLATGGPPFQMHTMSKAGVPGPTATSLPLVKYFTYMIIFCSVGLYTLIFRADVLNGLDPVMKGLVITFSWIGIATNLAIPLFILICSFVRPIGEALLRFALKIGRFLRVVKNPGKSYLKAQRLLVEYQKSLKSTGGFVSIFLLAVFNFIVYATVIMIPYFVILAFTGGKFVAADMLSNAFMVVFVLLAASFFPAPGGSGAAELSFGAVFAAALAGSALPVAMLTWRFITFYSFILIGICIVIYDQIKAGRQNLKTETAVTYVEIPDISVPAPQEQETGSPADIEVDFDETSD